MGTGCPPNTAEYLKIYSDLAAVEDFAPVLSAAMGVLVEIRHVSMLLWTKKKKLKKQVCQGFSYVMSKYSVCDDIWNYYFWSKILCRKMLQSFRKLLELFNTEYVISFIMTKYVFTCRYWQYCARNPTKVVGIFFFFLEKCPHSRFQMVWIHSTYFQRDLPICPAIWEC